MPLSSHGPVFLHFAFFAAMARSEADSPAHRLWTASLAGLRLVDWVLEHERKPSRDVYVQLYELIERAPMTHHLCNLLHSVVVATEYRDYLTAVPKALMAFGRGLLSSSEWMLAEDVLSSTIVWAMRAHQPEIELSGHHLRVYAFRESARYDDAIKACDLLAERAGALASIRYDLEAELSRAKVALARGNLPEARAGLHKVARRAEQEGDASVLGKSLVESGIVAATAEQYDEALSLFWRGYGYIDDAREREGVMVNIARALTLTREYNAARDAAMILSVSAQEHKVQLWARLHLMELAIEIGDKAGFFAARRELMGALFTPQQETHYLLLGGRGEEQFGSRTEAFAAYQKALEVAEALEIHEDAARAATAIDRLTSGAPESKPAGGMRKSTPPAVAEVVSGIAELRHRLVQQ